LRKAREESRNSCNTTEVNSGVPQGGSSVHVFARQADVVNLERAGDVLAEADFYFGSFAAGSPGAWVAPVTSLCCV
jgi:hypothetical protein